MPDRHEQRGFLDDSRINTVPLKAFETSTNIGNIIESQRERETETTAETNIDNGKPHEATDTLGDWKRDGLKQCKRCGIAQDEQKDFRTFLLNQVEYRCSYCRDCEREMAKTRRFNKVIPLDPYPKRIPNI